MHGGLARRNRLTSPPRAAASAPEVDAERVGDRLGEATGFEVLHPHQRHVSRNVDLFARDLQLQERLTTQIAGCLEEQLQPKGVGVVLEAEHLCMSLRGVQKTGAKTVTSALHGLVRDDPRTREEFLSLTGGRTR